MARYRRVEPDRGERLGAALAGVAVGTVVGALSWYVARIMLSREELPRGARDALRPAPSRPPRLPAGD